MSQGFDGMDALSGLSFFKETPVYIKIDESVYIADPQMLTKQLVNLDPGSTFIYYRGPLFNCTYPELFNGVKTSVNLIIGQAYLSGNYAPRQRLLHDEFYGPYPMYEYLIKRLKQKQDDHLVWIRNQNNQVANDRRSLKLRLGA